MSHWKLAGHPNSPMGDVIQWNWPLPGIVKAVNFYESSSSCICQNSEVRSSVVKMVESALWMSLMHSVISFTDYLSMWEFWLSSLKS
jgi:hypothetical protein